MTDNMTKLGKVVTPPGRDWAAFTLALGLASAVNLVTIAVLVDAMANLSGVGLSENATQLLTNAFSGIVGLLGSYIGFRAGAEARNQPGEPGPAGEDGHIVQVMPVQTIPGHIVDPKTPGMS